MHGRQGLELSSLSQGAQGLSPPAEAERGRMSASQDRRGRAGGAVRTLSPDAGHPDGELVISVAVSQPDPGSSWRQTRQTDGPA